MKVRIAENIKSLRRQHGLTQEQFAEALETIRSRYEERMQAADKS